MSEPGFPERPGEGSPFVFQKAAPAHILIPETKIPHAQIHVRFQTVQGSNFAAGAHAMLQRNLNHIPFRFTALFHVILAVEAAAHRIIRRAELNHIHAGHGANGFKILQRFFFFQS